MNTFDQKLKEAGHHPLTAYAVTTLQVNIGYRCNLRCRHCHIEASPDRKEMMSLRTLAKLLDILRENDEITTVDITGGSPELNPYFKYYVKSCYHLGKTILVRSNLAIYTESGMEEIPDFLADNRVKIIASLPCYSAEGVDSHRGKGTFEKAMRAFRLLNGLGYGKEGSGLQIDIMFNPAGASAAPEQQLLESSFKTNLFQHHGIVFNRLIAFSNMPIGRLGTSLSEEDRTAYLKELQNRFNPATIQNLMCRNLISVSPDGVLHDCDFWQVLNLPINTESHRVEHFDYVKLSNREIVTNPLCFMCTAGAGASCSGTLV